MHSKYVRANASKLLNQAGSRRRISRRWALLALALPVLGLGTRSAQAQTQTWDGGFDGIDSAADDVANYLRWDSAIDDDWDEPNDSFQLNTPSPGFMTVDRVANPADADKTGNIWIRDPILSYADGFTMEVTVDIQPDSEANAFSMTYLDQGGSFGVQLSPDSIKVGGLAPTDPGNTVTYDTSNGFHTYWMEQLPNSHTVLLYVDGVLVDEGQGTTNYAVGSNIDLQYPRVLIGDNSNDPTINADYVLENVEYRRGATSPTQTQQSFPARVLPAAPPPAVNETWTTGYVGTTGNPTASGWTIAGGGTFTPQSDGSTRLQGDTNALMDSIPSWTDMASITVEARIKVLPDSEEDGFQLVANDTFGDMALVLSPDKVTLEEAYSFVGQASITMNTTDAYHTYRMTRGPDGLYWDLYIDNNPTPAIVDQKSGGELIGFSRIWFGDIDFPIPGNTPDVDIDYIRWHQGDNAPATIVGPVTWNNAGGVGDGLTWDTTNQNWNSAGSPTYYSDGADVTFNDANSGHYNVTLNSIVSPNSVTVNNSSSNYTITGAGSIAGAATTLTKLGSDVLTLANTGVNTYGGGTTVSAGTLLIDAAGALPAASNVTITGGIMQLGRNTGAETLSSLSISGGGTFDVSNNHFILTYSGSQAAEDATIRGYLVSGYAGDWTGPGIDSSAVNGGTRYGVGYADGADGVVAGLASGQIEVAYAIYGDTNLDGVVNGTDFGVLAANFGQQVSAWDKGDFNYDGVVNGTDFGLLSVNFGQETNGADIVLPASDWTALDAFAAANGLLADVPEPGSLGLLAFSSIGVLARRRNRLKA
jgi:autotransporter-associated beta strand protein